MMSTGLSPTENNALTSGLDIPTAHIDVVPSGVTGKLLRYVTPDRLSSLLERCQSCAAVEYSGNSDSAFVAWLLPIGAYRASTGLIDTNQAFLLGQVAYRHVDYRTCTSMLELGGRMHPAAKALREEIAFSGARSASEANHVYTPHDRLPALFEELAEVLREPPAKLDPAVFAAVVGFYCSCLHPFKDGNGRWARIMTMQAGVAAGGSVAGAIACAYLAMFYAELAGTIWPASFANGLRRYLSLFSRFRDELRSRIDTSEQKQAIQDLLAALESCARSRREYERLLIRVFSHNALDLQDIKQSCGLSTRRLQGFTERIEAICQARHVPGLKNDPALIAGIWAIASEAKLSALEAAK